MDPEMEAVGQAEEIQIIQLAMHTQEEEAQVPIPQEEESRQAEGHHWTDPESPYQSYCCYLRTTRTAAFWTCNRCSRFGVTGPRLPSLPGEEMLKDIGLLKFRGPLE